LDLSGLEVDNLLAVLALLGLLRALEHSRPEWRARVSWVGRPWRARLHLSADVTEDAVASTVNEAVSKIASSFEFNGHINVNFTLEELRAYFEAKKTDPINALLLSALCAEQPLKKGEPRPAPLVMMFGQGHQNFLERLVTVSRLEALDEEPRKKGAIKKDGATKIAEALFKPWKRTDKTASLRWDPLDDQRYALRFGDPSKAGAASTVHGANRLACIGLLSFPCLPNHQYPNARGAARQEEEVVFVWPVWAAPLSLACIEALLSHPEVMAMRTGRVRALGVAEIYRARRVSNGKFRSVTRGIPEVESAGQPASRNR